MIELLLLSVVQGVTEFLPISSSAHLILLSKYFNFSNSNLTLDVSLHLGSLLAIILYFKEDLKNFIQNRILFLKIIITSIPITLVGFVLVKINFLDFFRSYKIIGWSTLIFGLVLFISDLRKTDKNIETNFSYRNAIFIGLFQVLALIPGVSRSGITITGARFLNLNRIDSAKISFLTSIPILSIVSLYNLQKILIQNNLEISILNLVGVIMSFFFSYITIKFFLYFLKKSNLLLFVIYRIILGTFILTYVYL
jgi:undecaprenyl-diphosphatase